MAKRNEAGKSPCGAWRRKLLAFEDLARFREENRGRRIVFTNGCFDVLHVGHLRCLQFAAAQGDLLVVGLNRDDSVRRLKGEGRPLNGENERAEMLCGYDFVSRVVLFGEDTPIDVIRALRPDVLVKGANYRVEEIAGADLVGEVVLAPLAEGYSTTGTIRKAKTSPEKTEK